MDIHFLYPSGNPTAIVCHKPNNPNQKYFIGKKIIEIFPSIEQVGFIYKENTDYSLEMVGDELCINAALCAFSLLNRICTKKIEKIYLKGPDRFIDGTVLGDEDIKISFGLNKNHIGIGGDFQEELYEVNFPGITHFYLKQHSPDFDNISHSLFNLFKDTLNVGAIGINQFTEKNESIQLETYVMVKGAGTIIKETACGSGCLGLTAIFLSESEKEINLNILQASGKTIETRGIFQSNDKLLLEIINNVRYIGKIPYLSDYTRASV